MVDPKKRGKIRDQIDAFAIAILMAVLMKYFVIEAYQIPTSSMQPTMMGSKSAGVFDRILVDKSRNIYFDPDRWDIAVFRYPIRVQQSYVKRIGGMSGETLRIAGGNLYLVHGADPYNPDDLSPLPRPTGVQEEHWKEIFPARSLLRKEPRVLGLAFHGTGGDWREDADRTLTVKQRSDRSRSSLVYADPAGGGISNRVYDGYPDWIAQEMINAGESDPGDTFARSLQDENVQDVRVTFAITPEDAVGELEVSIRVVPTEGPALQFALVAADGKGRVVVERDGTEIESSQVFPLPLAANTTTHLRFAHIDDRCIVDDGGTRVVEMNCGKYKTLGRLLPANAEGERGHVTLRVAVRGGQEVSFQDLRVERDLHYVPTLSTGAPDSDVIRVPDGHFFMLGDNTLQSVDSRDWTAITLGMDADGQLVDPKTHPDARRLVGNLRAVPLGRDVDPDENPVIVTDEKKVVFTDLLGEVWSLDGEVAMNPSTGHVYDSATPWMMGSDGPWLPEQTKIQFVPREHIIGRPLLTFWPGFRPYRLGFIR